MRSRSTVPRTPRATRTTYEEGETPCEGEDADLKVVVWKDYTDPESNQVYTSNFNDIPIDGDGLVIVIAFVPDDVDVEMPSWASDLPALGAADTGAVPTTLAPGETAPEATATETTTDGTEPGATETTEATESETTEPPPETTEPAPETTEDTSDTTEG